MGTVGVRQALADTADRVLVLLLICTTAPDFRARMYGSTARTSATTASARAVSASFKATGTSPPGVRGCVLHETAGRRTAATTVSPGVGTFAAHAMG